MTAPTVGSLFTGYSGLDHALTDAIGPARLAWVCDNDRAATKLLAHHHPDVPNLGDITAVNWATVQRVDILTGGFPCQDISHAGLRAGLTPGTRSGLWARMADAIDHLRPALVVAENVRGLLSVRADSDVEPCPWCLGDDEGEPPLRALGAVLADLAELGYDAVWHGLRASDVGAPHARFRVFVVAWPQSGHPDSIDRARGTAAGQPGEAGSAAGSTARPENDPHEHPAPGHRRDAAAADTSGDRRDEGRTEPARIVGGPDAPLGGADAPAHPDSDALRQQPVPEPRGDGPAVPGRVGVDWGPYAAAVARWERVLGRPAPAPTEPSRTGGQRLSAWFVEHMMGCDPGWVCDVPGISRNDQLRLLGNGVVRQQGATAIRHLLAVIDQLAGVAA